MATEVVCRICKTVQPVIRQRNIIRRHCSLSDPDFYCEGSLKPKDWGLSVDDLPLATDVVGPL